MLCVGRETHPVVRAGWSRRIERHGGETRFDAGRLRATDARLPPKPSRNYPNRSATSGDDSFSIFGSGQRPHLRLVARNPGLAGLAPTWPRRRNPSRQPSDSSSEAGEPGQHAKISPYPQRTCNDVRNRPVSAVPQLPGSSPGRTPLDLRARGPGGRPDSRRPVAFGGNESDTGAAGTAACPSGSPSERRPAG